MSYLANYDLDPSFPDTKWEFIFGNLDPSSIEFKQHSKVNKEFRQFRKEFVNFNDLEGYVKKHIGYFLKDITFTGSLPIVLRDVLFIKEIKGHEDNVQNLY